VANAPLHHAAAAGTAGANAPPAAGAAAVRDPDAPAGGDVSLTSAAVLLDCCKQRQHEQGWQWRAVQPSRLD
jgi:hypothetical protein